VGSPVPPQLKIHNGRQFFAGDSTIFATAAIPCDHFGRGAHERL
jgi:hypothetical protein